MPDTIVLVLGSRNNRKYLDAIGRELKVGDIVHYPTARASSVQCNYGRIVAFKDLSSPAVLGWGKPLDEGERPPIVQTWDRAYEVNVEYLDLDKVSFQFKRPDVYEPGLGYRDATPADKPKVNTIKRVDRVIRLDVDV
jgi:hypothetical protein